MKNLPINQRDSWSLLPNGKPTNEPTPNAFSSDSFPKETIDPTEDSKAILDGYYTLIVFVTSGILIGAVFTAIAFYALYGTAIERGKLIADTDSMIQRMQYNTDVVRLKIADNEGLIVKVNENIEKLGSGIVQELKPKEAKIVENK